MNKKQIYILICLTAVCLLAGGCGQKKRHGVKKGILFDTMISVSVLCDSQEQGETLLDEAFAMCSKFENIFSRTKEESDLYRLNHRSGNEVTVSEDLYALLSCAKEYYEKTNGRFDISVAPLSDLWNFKSETPKSRMMRKSKKH
ncbi:MAG: FAD:protein FMN transferase [Blautia marasmi]